VVFNKQTTNVIVMEVKITYKIVYNSDYNYIKKQL